MKEYFKRIGKVRYEGPESKKPLAFKHYNPKEKVGRKTMAEHLRFSVVYWHTMKGGGTDPFGPTPVYDRPWDASSDPLQVVLQRPNGLVVHVELIGLAALSRLHFRPAQLHEVHVRIVRFGRRWKLLAAQAVDDEPRGLLATREEDQHGNPEKY